MRTILILELNCDLFDSHGETLTDDNWLVAWDWWQFSDMSRD